MASSEVPIASWQSLCATQTKGSETLFLIDLIFKHFSPLNYFPPKDSVFQKCNCCLEIATTRPEKLVLEQVWVSYRNRTCSVLQRVRLCLNLLRILSCQFSLLFPAHWTFLQIQATSYNTKSVQIYLTLKIILLFTHSSSNKQRQTPS